jgi:hypothetical protein
MALSAMLILEIVIIFSFIITSIFMFKPNGNEAVHKIFFWLAVALSVLVTFIDATALPENYRAQVIIAWCGLIFSALGIIIRTIAGKTNAVANVLVMVCTLYGIAGYFLLA